jgi:uncharacterized protein (DUF433 family)
MVSVSSRQATIIRTERGLTIAGTRITLYDVMDYVTAQYPPQFIRGLFSLTDEQMTAALDYIERHRSEVDAEYQVVLREAEALRLYYEAENHDRIATIAAKPPTPETAAIRAKLAAERVRLNAEA